MKLTLITFIINVCRLAVSRNNTQTIFSVTSFRLLRIKSSVKKCRLGTSKCHDHDIFILQQPIRLQHFERGNENAQSGNDVSRIRIPIELLK